MADEIQRGIILEVTPPNVPKGPPFDTIFPMVIFEDRETLSVWATERVALLRRKGYTVHAFRGSVRVNTTEADDSELNVLEVMSKEEAIPI